MGEVRFMISEAAKKVHVESHVLRYWEEELGLRSAERKWDIDIIPKMTYSFSAVSKD
mgnify:CR=1 FL=1